MGIPLLLKKAGAVFAVFVILCLSLPQAALAGDWFTEIRKDYQNRFGDSEDPYADETGEALEQTEAELPVPPDSGTGIPDDWFDEIKTGYEEPEAGEPAVTAPEEQENTGEPSVPHEESEEDNEDQSLPQIFSNLEGILLVSEGFELIVESQGKAIITRYVGEVQDLRVPSVLENFPVRYIEKGAFEGHPGLKRVTLPDGLEMLGDDAFRNCTGLEEIIFPSGLKDIGLNTLRNCTALIRAVLPAELTEIPGGMFRECTSLEIISIPGKVRTIGSSAFYGCTSLKEVTIPRSVKEILEYAFSECPGVTLRVYKGSYAQQYAESKKIRYQLIPETEGMEFYVSSEFEYAHLIKYTGMATELIIPSTYNGYPVEHIGYNTFNYKKNLVSVTLPDSLIGIMEYAFSSCTSLETIDIPDSVTLIYEGAFYNCSSLKTVVLPKGLQVLRNSAFSGCKSLESVMIQEGVSLGYSGAVLDRIEDWTFANCPNLKSVTIPANVKYIADSAFSGSPEVTLKVRGGSYAQNFAVRMGIPWTIIR
jgi:hypothetical protein